MYIFTTYVFEHNIITVGENRRMMGKDGMQNAATNSIEVQSCPSSATAGKIICIPYSSDDAVDFEKDQMIFPSSSRLLGGSPDDDESDGEDKKVPSGGAVDLDATTKT
ncbi:MAG: hypothetical protein AAFR59_20060, partial [Bacteroidota bacterium]